MVEHWEVRAEERGGGVVWGGVGWCGVGGGGVVWGGVGYPELLLIK